MKDKKQDTNKYLQTSTSVTEINELKQNFKTIYSSSVTPAIDRRLKQLVETRKNPKPTKNQIEERDKLNEFLTYSFMLDNGTLLSSIPDKPQKQYGLLSIREKLIIEHNCKTASELILVDQIAAAYWRLMKYEAYASRLPEKDEGYSFDQLKVNVLKEARQQIEQAHRQITMSLTLLKDLKQPQLRVNVKTNSAYFAQNQQVVNEKPKEEEQVETIKPK